MSKVYAGVVTYNPEIKRLKDNILAIQKQVPFVIIFDNGSSNFGDIQKIASEFSNVKVLVSKINVGIAAALNKLMQWGRDNDYVWMLLSIKHYYTSSNTTYHSNNSPLQYSCICL